MSQDVSSFVDRHPVILVYPGWRIESAHATQQIIALAATFVEVFMPLKMLSVVGFLMMVSGIVALTVTKTLISALPPAIIAQVAAVALMLWARRTFGRRSFHLSADPTDGGLVTTGPYQFVRHPIYTAVCIFVWAAVLGSPSIQTFLFAVLVTIGAVMRIFCEEHLLVQQYPEYESYSRKTKRMIPFVF